MLHPSSIGGACMHPGSQRYMRGLSLSISVSVSQFLSPRFLARLVSFWPFWPFWVCLVSAFFHSRSLPVAGLVVCGCVVFGLRRRPSLTRRPREHGGRGLGVFLIPGTLDAKFRVHDPLCQTVVVARPLPLWCLGSLPPLFFPSSSSSRAVSLSWSRHGWHGWTLCVRARGLSRS